MPGPSPRGPEWARHVDVFSIGVGLSGLYPFLLLASLANPRLQGPTGLYTAIASLVTSYGLHKLYRATGARWALAASLTLLALVAARPAAALAGAPSLAHSLLDAILAATIGLSLHRLSQAPTLDPLTAARLDRQGGFIVLAVFLSLLPLPLLAIAARAFAGALMIQAYLTLSRIHYQATRGERLRLTLPKKRRP